MESQIIRSEESLGLLWALGLHGALVLAMVLFRPAPGLPAKEGRMTVTLGDNFAMEATSPNPTSEFKPDTAPELGDVPPPPAPDPQPVTKPSPTANTANRPTTRPTTRPTARPTGQANQRNQRNQQNTRNGRAGGEQVGADFLDGMDGPATPSSQQRAAFQSSIIDRVRPRWQGCAPSGLDVERLRIVVSFTLTREGRVQSIAEPQVRGENESNRRQVTRWKECAERAIRLAAPYSLPPQFYEFWRDRQITFSNRNAS